VHAPHDFPGAAVIRSSRRRQFGGRGDSQNPYHCSRPSEKGGVGDPSGQLPIGRGCWNLRRGPALFWRLSKEAVMDKEHIKGAADKAKGAMKDAAGKMMDDKGLQAEGKMDKAKGEARQALGDAKDAVRHANDK
jgi:uncharacterized protein YjbJ (UPF0337 family)